MQVTLEAAPGTGDGLVWLPREMTERLRINLDTLQYGVPVTVTFRQPRSSAEPPSKG